MIRILKRLWNWLTEEDSMTWERYHENKARYDGYKRTEKRKKRRN